MKTKFQLASQESVSTLLGLMAIFYALDNYPFNSAATSQNLKKFIVDPSLGRLWLILVGEEIVGYIVLAFGFSFEYGGKDAFIDEFFIEEGNRNQGIGAETMAFVTRQARLLGIKTLHLEVESHNKIAAGLYVKQGFKDNGRLLLSSRISD